MFDPFADALEPEPRRPAPGDGVPRPLTLREELLGIGLQAAPPVPAPGGEAPGRRSPDRERTGARLHPR